MQCSNEVACFCKTPWRRVGQSDEDGMVSWVLPCLTNALPGRTTLMDASNEITDQQLHFLPENLSCLNWGFRVGLVR